MRTATRESRVVIGGCRALRSAFVLGALSGVSCISTTDSQDDTEPAIGGIASPLYYLSTALWTVRPIPVCWTSLPGTPGDADIVRNAIERSFPQFGNVSFAGWGTCPSPFSGIAITPGINNVVTGGLGAQADGVSDVEVDLSASPQTRWTQCTVNSLNRADCIGATAIHEFGHSLSYAHEHLRPDNMGMCGGMGGTPGDTTFGAFDNNSIMSYCLTAPAGIAPDQTDVQGTISVYGMAPALVATISPQ